MQLLRTILPLLISISAMPLPTAAICSAGYEGNNAQSGGQTIVDNDQVTRQPNLDPKDDQTRMVIVDSDFAFGSDEGMALCMLLRSPSIKLLGVTSSSGNVWTEQASMNLLQFFKVIEHPQVPVHPGVPSQAHADRLKYYNDVEKHAWAKGVYSGALGHEPELPPTTQEPPGVPKLSVAEPTAVDFIREQARKFPRQVTLLVFGPATNLAAALHKEPHLAKDLREVFVFGGAIHVPGNTTKAAEFNFWFDPESANAILKAGIRLTLVPLDATNGRQFDAKMTTFFAKGQSPMEKYLNEYFENRLKRRGGRPIPIWNEALVGLFLDPSIILSAKQEFIRVDITHGPDYGVSRSIAKKKAGHEKLVKVIYQVNTVDLQNMIYRLFR